MKANSITIFCPMAMLDKHIICINVLVLLFVSGLVSCLNCITSQHSWLDMIQELYQNNIHLMCIYHIQSTV